MDEDISTLQSEESEVLKSIYEGDDAFLVLADNQFQYKVGEDGAQKSFILQLTWGQEYPNQAPEISVESFYNRHLKDAVKVEIVDKVREEAEQYLGMSMSYSLFEFAKENQECLLKNQPEEASVVNPAANTETASTTTSTAASKPKEKKEQLTKAQKRRMWDKGGLDTEERPRGWDWIDVIRHLSQTGSKEDS